MNRLDRVLKHLQKPKREFLICGDFNVNFLEDNGQKKLVLLLQSYNIISTVQFPIRITENSSTAIDRSRINSSETSPISNV
jgi:exonuclease III